MPLNPRRILSYPTMRRASLRWCACALLIVLAHGAHAANQLAKVPSFGIAWRVQGVWEQDGTGKTLANGDAIFPGSLLLPGSDNVHHSITVLLPDGQLVLYQCYATDDCQRGFRVPALYRVPKPLEIELIGRVHAELEELPAAARSGRSEEPSVPQDETLVVTNAQPGVQISGLASMLSNGRYRGELQSIEHRGIARQKIEIEKNGRSIPLPISSPGLYELVIYDQLGTPRIDLLLGVVNSARGPAMVKTFQDVSALLSDWNEDYQGWPIHGLRRAYLEALMRDVKMLPVDRKGSFGRSRPGVTAEPAFTPTPGVFKGDTAVSLKCSTPNATIHYTVDSAQPLANSPVYHAPIMVKGTALMIRAFATAAGKKDSPVVTGIFRIGDD